jgi:hypothetical protein
MKKYYYYWLVILGFFFLIVLALLNRQPKSSKQPSTLVQQPTGSTQCIPMGVWRPPLEEVCNYPLILLRRQDLGDAATNQFDPTYLDEAQRCGTKVIVWLYGLTTTISDTNGFNLSLYQNLVNDFQGHIEPYISSGTIMAHLAIDEPQDCHDWNYICPTADQVEQAAAYSKQLWPNMPVLVNTSPEYASQKTWSNVDLISFQYAFHKGDLNQYVQNGLSVYQQGKVDNIAWSIAAGQGGGSSYGEQSMTLDQLRQVATAMCNTSTGVGILLVPFEATQAEGVSEVLAELKTTCGCQGLPPTATPTNKLPTATSTPPSFGGPTATPTKNPQATPTPTRIPSVTPTPTPTAQPPTATPTPNCSVSTKNGDLNHDCVINSADWAVMWKYWTDASEL